MALSAFDDRKARPTDRTLDQALGRAAHAWASLKASLIRECAPLQEQWAFAGAKYGWSLRLKRGERVIVYMTPCLGHFLASLALGEKACTAAREASLPAGILTLIEEAPKYAEGRGIRIPVRTEKEARSIRKLAAIKLAH
jgi:hypothetical protein